MGLPRLLASCAVLLLAAACSSANSNAPQALHGTSVVPQVVQQNTGAPYVPMTFNQLNVSTPGVLSTVRAADGLVYFSVFPNSGPLGTTFVAFSNDAVGNVVSSDFNYPGSNLAADASGNVYFLGSSSDLHVFRSKTSNHYATNLPSSLTALSDIAVGSDGNLYVLFENGGATYLWQRQPTGATHITSLSIPNAALGHLVNGPDSHLYAQIALGSQSYIYRIAYTGSNSRYAVPAPASNLAVAGAYIWFLTFTGTQPVVHRLSTSGGLGSYAAPSSSACSSPCRTMLSYAGGSLWFLVNGGVAPFNVTSASFGQPVHTNIPPGQGFIATQGSDGNLWAASADGLASNGTPDAAVILTHILSSAPTSAYLYPGSSQLVTVSETGSCSTLSATSSNPSVATVSKTSSSCNQSTFTVTTTSSAAAGATATITFSDNSAAYKSNRITFGVTVNSPT